MYGFIAEHRQAYPVTFMCQILGVSRASFYRWVRPPHAGHSPRQERHQIVTAAITRAFVASAGRLGRRPMRHVLAHQYKVHCSLGLVHRIMAEQGFVARRRRSWKRTTTQDPADRVAHLRNHCLDAGGARCFRAATPGTRTVGDLTYLPTSAGWLYLAVVLDLATRAVIGWAIQPQMQTDLVVSALTMAKQHGRLQAGAIFHSDRGSQYTSARFQAVCRAFEVTQSLGATGVCWDNAVAEAFFATLKADLTELGARPTPQALRAWLVLWMEGWYNRHRPHQTNDGLPPMTAWERCSPPPLAVSYS